MFLLSGFGMVKRGFERRLRFSFNFFYSFICLFCFFVWETPSAKNGAWIAFYSLETLMFSAIWRYQHCLCKDGISNSSSFKQNMRATKTKIPRTRIRTRDLKMTLNSTVFRSTNWAILGAQRKNTDGVYSIWGCSSRPSKNLGQLLCKPNESRVLLEIYTRNDDR